MDTHRESQEDEGVAQVDYEPTELTLTSIETGMSNTEEELISTESVLSSATGPSTTASPAISDASARYGNVS